jgi:putative oxidoreductase
MMAAFKLPGWITLILRAGIAAIFIYAGGSKAFAPLRLITDIDNFHLLPWEATAPLAFYLPWLEIVCGIALFLGRLELGALLVVFVLTSLFVVALTSARVRGFGVSCGCFGHGTPDLSLAAHLALNLGMMGAVLLLLRTRFLPRGS